MTVEQLKEHLALMDKWEPDYSAKARKWYGLVLFWVDLA